MERTGRTVDRVGAFLAVAFAAGVYGEAQPATLSSILERAAQSVAAAQDGRSGIVAEESYIQDFETSSTSITSLQSRPAGHRELKSDLLLVQTATPLRYVEFRDVFEVDGRPVRDREERLARLFLDGSRSAARQLAQIVADGARYNIGSIQRTLNIPTLALLFLRAENQDHIRFRGESNRTPRLIRQREPGMPPSTVVVGFEEPSRNTLIRTAADKDLPSHGRFWIDPESGAVLMSELIADDPLVSAVIDVRYDVDPGVGVRIPVEMREHYEGRNGATVDGHATYANFRRFQVQVESDTPLPR